MLDESKTLVDANFKGIRIYLHIDEKWFYTIKKEQTYCLLHHEGNLHRSCQNKTFIGKVMFLAATAHPKFDDEGMVIFYGKIWY